MMLIRPIKDRVLVKPVRPERSAIITTDYEPDMMGEVLAVGPGALCDHCGKRTPPKVYVGQVVCFPATVGQKFVFRDEGAVEPTEYLMVEGADILGAVELV